MELVMQAQQHGLVRTIMTAVCESAVCGEIMMLLHTHYLSYLTCSPWFLCTPPIPVIIYWVYF